MIKTVDFKDYDEKYNRIGVASETNGCKFNGYCGTCMYCFPGYYMVRVRNNEDCHNVCLLSKKHK